MLRSSLRAYKLDSLGWSWKMRSRNSLNALPFYSIIKRLSVHGRRLQRVSIKMRWGWCKYGVLSPSCLDVWMFFYSSTLVNVGLTVMTCGVATVVKSKVLLHLRCSGKLDLVQNPIIFLNSLSPKGVMRSIVYLDCLSLLRFKVLDFTGNH